MRGFCSPVVAIGLLLAVPSGWAAPAPPAAPTAPAPAAETPGPSVAAQALRDDIDKTLATAGLEKTTVAVRIVALADASSLRPAEPLYTLRADLPLIPASNMKLMTTAACLDRLGPDWRLKTHIGRLPVEGRTGEWDLAVIGGGDPNFSGRFYNRDTVGAFRKWAEVLKAAGVKALGRIVLDDTLFDSVLQHPHWPPDQRGEWYEAPVSALGLCDNCLEIHVAPGAKAGDPARVWIDPPSAYAAIEGTITTVAERSQHAFSLQRIADEKSSPPMRIRASGRYLAGAAEAIEYRTVADPTMFFGAALVEALRAEGLAVAGPVVRERLVDKDGHARGDLALDIIHTSRLDATIAVADKRSQGMYAECLLKILGAWGPTPQIAAVIPPRQGTWANGAEEIRRWMVERGIPADGCVIDDGSGLSKENRLTALAVSELLAVMYERHGDTFVQSLAVAGQDGSLARRMRGTGAEGRVFGKTGYVFGASALSGYVRARSGRTLAYSILMNDVPWGELWKARQAQDKICVRLVDY
jgi:D-alanyl-D-alanine carboxypeptidase/D-alanyl-D-alanine-endopeptidase (penicillin-binding protein 4)